MNVPFSILDLCPVAEGSTPADAFRNSLDLAQHAENWGYQRFWVAEHHNMPGIASAATAVVIAHIAGGTKTMRVGAGGIMLPNHSPLTIAEQFGTLASLFPGRIDLGLGRAPGTDQLTARALRRDAMVAAHAFPSDVIELRRYFGEVERGQAVRAVPGAGLHVPLWILGSSTFGAQLAARLGLPYAFASHFAPEQIEAALSIYHREFQPSRQLDRPYVMLGVNVVAAETDAEARRLFSSIQLQFLRLRRGMPGLLPPPVDELDAMVEPLERAGIEQALRYSAVGAPPAVEQRLREILERHRPDELILTAQIFDHAARLHSFELAAQVRDRLRG